MLLLTLPLFVATAPDSTIDTKFENAGRNPQFDHETVLEIKKLAKNHSLVMRL
jgi:hypothetical protein